MKNIIFLILIIFNFNISFASTDDARSEQIIEIINKKFPNQSGSGVAVMVIGNGFKVFEYSRGMANIDRKIPINSDTVFELASVAKPITALAVMILKSQGKIDYQDKIGKYLPELKIYGDQITIEQLLNHTSGLPDNSDMYEVNIAPTIQEIFDLVEDAQMLDFPAGSKFYYNNTNYILLSQIIARASGMSFGNFIKRNIFDVAGMTNSVAVDEYNKISEDHAKGYYKPKNGKYQVTDSEALNYTYGDVNIHSSLNDMYKFDQALQEDKFVARSELDLAFTSNILPDGTDSKYGYGWSVEKINDELVVYHDGYWTGFNNLFYRFPNIGMSIIILSNSDDLNVYELSDKILEIYGY
jgi:CubicO group peptidase (beta-lactamase class C family)